MERVATTAIAGILHFVLISPPTNPYALGTNIPVETFFIVTGIWTNLLGFTHG